MEWVNKVGIALATYNGEKYIYEQLVSIVTQSVKPDIIVVSDGGSSDQTVSICKKVLSEFDIPFKVLTSNKRLSVRENFEKSIMSCEAKYVFLSDQDDVWMTTKIEDFLHLFEKYNPAMIFANAELVDEKMKFLNKTLWGSINYSNSSDVVIYQQNDEKYYNELVKHNIVTGMCVAIDHTWIDKVIPFSKHAIHDVWIGNVIGFYAPVLAYSKCVVKYRQHAGNVVGTSTSLAKAYTHRNRYIKRLNEDILLSRDIINKCTNNDIANKYYSLESFLKFRKNYIERKEKNISLVKHIQEYRRFNNNWKQILMKDIYARCFMAGAENDTKI